MLCIATKTRFNLAEGSHQLAYKFNDYLKKEIQNHKLNLSKIYIELKTHI